MFQMKYKNLYIAKSVKVAESFFARLKGLMFVSEMVGYDGLLIKHCNSIHTCFMKFKLDVVFLNDDYQIKKIIRGIVPWRITGIYLQATQVLELKSGAIPVEIKEGDYLIFEEGICLS